VDARGRYAPSPTGRLHLGNVRTALVAWLQMRALGGRFVLRVEDVDFGRCRPEHQARQLTDLRWLGLDWDEGPDVGGAFGPYVQSQRGELYAAALARLPTFQCSCTRKQLREQVPSAQGAEPVYPGTCRDAGPQDPAAPRSIRWHVPVGEVDVLDEVFGRVHNDLRVDVGDFVLRRSDGAWAYQLAVVVDDAAMAITHVCRGADLLDSAPRQVALARALGHEPPRFAHVPLVVGPDGIKLSKRHGAPDVSELREGGADPERVVAVLARSLGLVASSVPRVRAADLIADFAMARIRAVAGPGDVIDPADLR
jgi:glutamyl-tRNA synthetase